MPRREKPCKIAAGVGNRARSTRFARSREEGSQIVTSAGSASLHQATGPGSRVIDLGRFATVLGGQSLKNSEVATQRRLAEPPLEFRHLRRRGTPRGGTTAQRGLADARTRATRTRATRTRATRTRATRTRATRTRATRTRATRKTGGTEDGRHGQSMGGAGTDGPEGAAAQGGRRGQGIGDAGGLVEGVREHDDGGRERPPFVGSRSQGRLGWVSDAPPGAGASGPRGVQ
jgi:hypothetical protein